MSPQQLLSHCGRHCLGFCCSCVSLCCIEKAAVVFTEMLSKESCTQELRDATLKLSPDALDKAAVGEREEAGFIGVAKHGYGCRVVQRVMEHCRLPGWKDEICRQVRAEDPPNVSVSGCSALAHASWRSLVWLTACR